MIEKSIVDIVRQMEEDDETGNTTISKYVTFSLRENIEKIDAYINSKHITGERDSMNREKPFFNIVTAAINIWYRATDIDRKNIKLKATKKADYVMAFIMSILLSEWMKKSLFGVFLNDWGRTLARYCSAISKFIEKGGKLIPEVMPWNVMIVDPVDFENNVKIQKLWFTPEQLRANKNYDQDMVKDLIEAQTPRETMDGQKKDNKSEYIELFEVHGKLQRFYLTDNEDNDDYVQQMHVVSYMAKKDGADPDDYDEFTLFRGKEKKCPYMIHHLIKEDGRTQGIGAVENLFESQWMVNHNAKAIKDQLDIASKLIFQTSDGSFVGQNTLSAIESGDILIHKVNEPLTMLNNKADISALQSYGGQWKDLGREINGIAESMVTQAKSGTAWRQTQAELQEAHSLFELMTENKGLAIEEMMRDFILPYLEKKMDTTDEIAAILESQQIDKLDSLFVPTEATKRTNKSVIDDILNKTPEDIERGNLIDPEEQGRMFEDNQEAIQEGLNAFGNQRFIKPSEIKGKTWKKVLKDFVWEVEVDITGESKDTQAMIATLVTYFQTLASLQGRPMSPEMQLVSDKILTATSAISPVELSEVKSNPQPVALPAAQPAEIPAPVAQ